MDYTGTSKFCASGPAKVTLIVLTEYTVQNHKAVQRPIYYFRFLVVFTASPTYDTHWQQQ